MAQGVAERRIHSLWLNFKGYGDKVFGFVAGASGTIWAFHIPDADRQAGPFAWVFGMSPAATVWFWIMIAFGAGWALTVFVVQRPRYSELYRLYSEASERAQDRADALEHSLNSMLRHLSKHCEVDGNDFRSTVYFFHNDRFIAVARHSAHPDHKKFREGHSHHSQGQGLIHEAWSNAEAYKADLPKGRAAWDAKMMSDYGYTEEQVSQFRMQSRSYGALRVEGQDGAVGVLVFESTRPKGVTRKSLSDARHSLIQAALADAVSTNASLTPQAEKNGSAEVASNKTPPRRWKAAPKRVVAAELTA